MNPTGFVPLDTLAIWCAAITAVTTGFGLFWKFIRGVRRLLKRLDGFVDDWNGVPARPGYPAQPGVMERLRKIEYALHPNSGESLRDAVNRIEAQVTPGAHRAEDE